MSATVAGFVADSFRWGSSSAPWFETVVIMCVIAVMALACVATFVIHQHRRERRLRPVADEWQALAVMSELCPHGWKAHLTLRGRDVPLPDDAPRSRMPLVELEWEQFEQESGQVATSRRVWAPTIEAALQTMAEDRWADA
jgi:hypothetical protein